jgi:hypothetical protein
MIALFIFRNQLRLTRRFIFCEQHQNKALQASFHWRYVGEQVNKPCSAIGVGSG